MSDQPTPLDFKTLRARAIIAAQDASGQIWTDYNLHDPGVTLLEQTAFALTEVAYHGDHAVRDLLTTPDGRFGADDLALFGPNDVLPGRPVTLSDIASCLSDLPELERVFVSPGPALGLIDIVIIPHDLVDPAEQARRTATNWQSEVIAAVRAHFLQIRLLATDIHQIAIAEPSPVALRGEIAIGPFAEPERIVATIIHQTRLLLKGLPADLADGTALTGATRADVFDNVAALWPRLPANASDTTRFEAALAVFRQIDGIEKIEALDLIDPDTGTPFDRKRHDQKTYHDPVLPRDGEPMLLRLTRNDAVVPLNLNTVREELGRIEAARIARQGNRKDKADWDVLFPGKPRDPTRHPLDASLPAPYRVPETPARGRKRTPAPNALSQYRRMMDQHLNAMAAPLGHLHRTYAQSASIDPTDPAAVRRRMETLEYLIALQGEEMPANVPPQLHAYRSLHARSDWQIKWRETYLASLPGYNHHTGTAHPVFGLAARLAHLADIAVADGTDHLTQDTLRIDEKVAIPAPEVAADSLILPTRPLDAFVTRDDTIEPLTLAKLVMSCPWIADYTTTPDLFQRATQTEAYILARNRKGDWDVLFQPVEGGGLYSCGTNSSRAKVEAWANRLRLSFSQLNERAEKLWLIEDINLRSEVADFAPSSGAVLIPGWTARTAHPAYRRYVEDLIAGLTPAHILLRPVWLSPADANLLLPMLTDWHGGVAGSGAALRRALHDLIENGHAS